MKKINDKNFKEELESSAAPAIVDFFATWCGPCMLLSPILEELSTEFPNVRFYKLDVDESPSVAAEFNIDNIPTLVFIKDKNVVNTVVGYHGKAELRAIIEAFQK